MITFFLEKAEKITMLGLEDYRHVIFNRYEIIWLAERSGNVRNRESRNQGVNESKNQGIKESSCITRVSAHYIGKITAYPMKISNC